MKEAGLKAGFGIYRRVDGPAITFLSAVLANDIFYMIFDMSNLIFVSLNSRMMVDRGIGSDISD